MKDFILALVMVDQLNAVKQFLQSKRIKRYFRANLGAPFILGFQALLLVCAGLLIQESSALANEVAIYAYYLLVIGVVLQLISFMRHRGEGDDGG